ncbi:MAG: sigma-54 dependent transcriptional regulator [Deltaproteobacteria bacterium]|nr:sigma-54 dependent transcriptional regulator [Myxococcales bacterium]MDP3219450.1 sigma-54 dependent transcriptional regulator [Deltaproteobacteria bacterium]
MPSQAPPPRARVLVVDDDRSIRRSLEKYLGDLGYAVTTAADGQEGLDALDAVSPDVVLLDLGLPIIDGLEFLERVRGREGMPPVLVVTARDDMRSTITAMQRGAWDYMVKPIDIERLKIAILRAIESRDLSRRLDGLVETLAADFQIDNIVGRSAGMREVFKTIGRVSTSRATVLITGESGTGKELVARAIHFSGESRDQPFVAVNCTAFARELLESELFGHVRGAFTGATSDKLGRFQIAGGGTLFLDEIGELPLDLQVKLLRVVQERTFERVGDARPMPLRARIITATHRDLAQMVREGGFREDFYYRLRVVEVHLPPLRERKEDIPALIDHLLAKVNRELHKKIRYVSREALDLLVRYPWPGNVRELENALTRAVVVTEGEVLDAPALPIHVDDPADEAADEESGAGTIDAPEGPDGHSNGAVDLASFMTLREIEHRHIAAVLAATGWNKRRSCGVLGITRPTLDRKIREYGLERPNLGPTRLGVTGG